MTEKKQVDISLQFNTYKHFPTVTLVGGSVALWRSLLSGLPTDIKAVLWRLSFLFISDLSCSKFQIVLVQQVRPRHPKSRNSHSQKSGKILFFSFSTSWGVNMLGLLQSAWCLTDWACLISATIKHYFHHWLICRWFVYH